ncbi:DUF3822 family protein [Pedobacter sp. MC2016-24]|uniref:DUF3822 family protein n=1 Tax=Pedobacter sp. MC2016-24 TaxID=2780090 RepID=UPI001881530F|nr:DUF3822 family protein [Pedobacter sp. MC2016-24]MBE9601447.1 DUF3822 family protein [Pedobacter sp. MC2016-24]
MDNKNNILLVDPEFDPKTAANCTLLLKIMPDSFSYAIIDKSSEKLQAVYDQQECDDVADTLAEKLKQDVYLSLPFKEIKAAVYTENAIAIPNELFDPADLNKYNNFFSTPQSGNLYTQPFASFGFTSIFTLQEFTETTLVSALENCRLYAQNASILGLAKNKLHAALILDFTATSFNAAYIKDGQLIFQNFYQTDNSEEFNYYLLLILNRLAIRPTETTAFLSGIIHEGDPNYQCIAKYFDQINFSLPPLEHTDQKILDDMPAHYYSSLLALDVCE